MSEYWTLVLERVLKVSYFPAVVPSAPSAISLLNCTGTSMVIGWRAPGSDGGDPVCGYYLDQLEKTQNKWGEINTKLIKERIYTVNFFFPLQDP